MSKKICTRFFVDQRPWFSGQDNAPSLSHTEVSMTVAHVEIPEAEITNLCL